MRRGRSDVDFTFRWPHLRLVQEGRRRQRDSRGPGPWSRLSHAHLQLLQEIWLQDPGDGGEFPECKSDRASGRFRFADDQPSSSRSVGSDRGVVERKLDPAKAQAGKDQRLRLTEQAFRWMHNEDAMATEKLAEGIRKFNSDAKK